MRNMPRSCVLPQKGYRLCPQKVGLRFTERLRSSVILVKFNLREVWFWPVGGFPWCWAYHPLCLSSPIIIMILYKTIKKPPYTSQLNHPYHCAFCQGAASGEGKALQEIKMAGALAAQKNGVPGDASWAGAAAGSTIEVIGVGCIWWNSFPGKLVIYRDLSGGFLASCRTTG